MSLTIDPPAADGTSQVTVVGRRMVDGSHWTVWVNDGEHKFRRTADGGTWSITTHVTFDKNTGEVSDAVASQKGVRHSGRGTSCSLVDSRIHPAGGAASCRHVLDVLESRRRDDGAVVTRFLIAFGVPGQRWHIALKAKDADSSQRLAFDGVTNRHGFLRSRVEFSSGLVTPHFGVVAQNDAGRYCRLRLNPAQIDDATLAPRRLLRVGSAS